MIMNTKTMPVIFDRNTEISQYNVLKISHELGANIQIWHFREENRLTIKGLIEGAHVQFIKHGGTVGTGIIEHVGENSYILFNSAEDKEYCCMLRLMHLNDFESRLRLEEYTNLYDIKPIKKP